MRLLVALALLTAACGGPVSASPTPAPAPLPLAELKYRVMDAGGRIAFCDPDFHPVARADEAELARQKDGEIRRDAATYAAITARVGTDTLAVYREWKALNALELTPPKGGTSVPDAWTFSYRSTGAAANASPDPKRNGRQIDGRVDASGRVNVTRRADAGPLQCPICLARATAIATPSGERAVEDLRVGDIVWTLGADGARLAAPLVAIGRTPVAATHQVVRLRLADGRGVLVSPGHPTADGQVVGALRAGDRVDGSVVVSAERVAYGGGFTFDIRPAGATGAYWADGVLLGSTLP